MPLLRSFPPIAAPDARLLIVGSMPGAASLAAEQYYAHPRNLFWRLLGDVLGEPLADLPYAERRQRLIAHRVALWDVLAACERAGSLDSAIVGSSVQVNDFAAFFAAHVEIRHVFANGALAAQTFRRYGLSSLGGREIALARLPSSSPAHAALNYATKLEFWRQALLPVLEKRGEPR